jgi:hypothetical protein
MAAYPGGAFSFLAYNLCSFQPKLKNEYIMKISEMIHEVSFVYRFKMATNPILRHRVYFSLYPFNFCSFQPILKSEYILKMPFDVLNNKKIEKILSFSQIFFSIIHRHHYNRIIQYSRQK